MNKQLRTELRYSKRMKSFMVLDSFINDLPFGLFQQLTHTIDSFRDGSYFPEKQGLVDRLPNTEHIAYELMIVLLSNRKRSAIQGLAISLGSAIGYPDLVEAAKIGSSLLSVCHGKLYDIELEPDGTFLVPKMCMDSETEWRCKALCYLPPIKENPPAWESNYGGWEWEQKSVILGNGNHHNKHQALDALNKIQQIPWVIDTEVLVTEKNTNKEMNQKQFNKIVGEYLGEQFYFTWRYDKRGRMYSSGYHLNPQSNEYGKALLNPANGEKCIEEGLRALKIAIANAAGKDKLTWDERVEWFDHTEYYSGFKHTSWKHPILGRKTLRAYDKAVKGEKINFFMELDATSSGCQLMACLSGCAESAKHCNLMDTGKRENLYDTVHKEIAKRTEISDDVKVKKATMTFFYNSRQKPRETFNDDQLEAFYDVVTTKLPGCNDVMEVLNSCWNYSALEHSFTMPDGHVCKIPVTGMAELKINVEELGDRRFTLKYERNQSSDNYRSLAPNIIHACDSFVMREMIRRCDFELSGVHDAYCFHPNHFNQVTQTYREILSEIASSNLLNDIVYQLTGVKNLLEIEDEGLSEMILNSKYALS